MAKSRLNISLDQDLIDFAKLFAAENRTTVADVFTQYLLGLKRRSHGETSQEILAHPAFLEAMTDVQDRLRTGKAEWHSFSDVFGE